MADWHSHFASTRRQFLQSLGFGVLACAATGGAPQRGWAAAATDEEAAGLATPTPEQLAWQEAELTMFAHFSMNTFTDREWGEGKEDPHQFQPTALDPRQWVRVAKECGFRYLIFTAKHHDGFCLWPSRYTEHSVKNSPWLDGKGDVVRLVADACHEAGIKLGLYLSPWDRHEPCYGDSPRYNQHFKDQLTEVLSNYGEVAEMWFDGACGEGPNGKKQEYDWQGYYEVVRRLQPHALIAICGPDIRWVGNETGVARETEWSVQTAPQGARQQNGGKAWYPAECDVSIRPGWFYHQQEDDKVKPLQTLEDIYYKSVGRNSEMLLNVPPDRRGLFADPDVARLREFRQLLDRTFAVDLALRRPVTASSTSTGSRAINAVDGDANTYWKPQRGALPATLEVNLGRPTHCDVVMLQEYIALGQRVEEYQLEAWDGAAWREVARGTTIGHKKLDRFTPVTTSKMRLTILKAQATPLLRRFGVFQRPTTKG